MYKMCGNRSMHTYDGKFYATPEGVNDVIHHLDTKKPTFTCLYFHAAWNPICQQIDKDYDTFC